MHLFLDDIREPEEAYEYMVLRIGEEKARLYKDLEWQVERDYDHFVRWIEDNGMPDTVSFDHDLAEEHYEIVCACGSSEDFPEEFEIETGYDCALYLVEYAKNHPDETFPEVLVHSMNPYGSERIKRLIREIQ